MNYNFDIEVAKEYGVNEAIMIANFQFWISKNKANKKNFNNGRYWVYNSRKAFLELFPFWSEQTIKTTLKHLKEKGILMSENFNTNRYDQTLWYAFVNENQWIGENQPIDWLKSTNGLVKTNQPIPDNKPDILPDNKPDNNIYNVPLKEKRFKKPTKDEVEEYINETGYYADAEQFIAYYDSVGWKVGKNPMKDWKSALRGWAIRDRKRVYDKPKPKALSKAQEIDRKNLEYLREMLGD